MAVIDSPETGLTPFGFAMLPGRPDFEAAGAAQGKALGQQTSAANLGQALAAAVTGVLFILAPAIPFLAAVLILMRVQLLPRIHERRYYEIMATRLT